MNNRLIEKIISSEFRMFQKVVNREGRAACQDDYQTFEIMRSSQFAAWSDAMVESYDHDLRQAIRDGRNLVAEKYAWMMQDTFPEEFEEIVSILPPICAGKISIIQEIVNLQTPMTASMYQAFPATQIYGRSLYTESAHRSAASSTTYLRGELCTYSLDTLRLYRDYLRFLSSQGRNLAVEILTHTVRRYGYTDLTEWNDSVCSRQNLP